MFICARAIPRSRPPSSLQAYRTPSRVYTSKQSQRCFTASSSSNNRSQAHHSRLSKARFPSAQRSGSSFVSVAVVLGIAVGGALLYPLVARRPEPIDKSTSRRDPVQDFDYSSLTDSFLVMAPNTPPGRPGTLTPEQDGKLRELWALTMKVFGVHAEEEAIEDVNGTEVPSEPASSAPSVAGGKEGKEKKKKSRLNVFKKKDKSEKSTGSGSATPSTTATPSDLSSLSLADDDDKHGQNKEFKAALANSSPEELRKAFWSMVKHDHPDALLLRFLRARKWDVEKALIMMISTMHWRAEEQHVDDQIVRIGELGALEETKSSDPKVKKEGEDFLAQLRMGKSFLHGLDKEGRPMCFVRVRLHKQGEQSEESIERFTVYTIETARMLLRPPVDTATIVFDMTDFSMANMDYAPVKFMIKCFEANYPESLGAVLVYKAPWIFNTVWSLIRGWLDPVVAGKVHFVKHPKDLQEFVPVSQIPVDMGGEEKWEYQYVEPKEGENHLLKEEGASEGLLSERQGIVKSYESQILNWIHNPEAETIEARRKERDTLAEQLRSNYWKLDPYVRARTLYDRIGLIEESGKLNFYPSKKVDAPTKEAVQAPLKAQETSAEDLD